LLEERANMPVPRFLVAMATKHEVVYCFGGSLNVIDISSHADSFSDETNSWTNLPDMPHGIEWGVAIAWKSLIYIAGINTKLVTSFNPRN
jgi:hypothetical protein